MSEEAKKRKIAFYTIHGIRTSDADVKYLNTNFELQLKNYQPFFKNVEKVDVIDGSYGYIGVIANALPIVRRLLQRKTAQELKFLAKLYDVIIIVSFSFGTYLSGQVFMTEELALYTDTEIYWVLFGGVVNCRYQFDKARTQPKKILNFCSLEDEVAKYAPWFFSYGHCGSYGFRYRNGVESKPLDGKEIVWYSNPKNIGGGEYSMDPWVINYHHNNEEHSKGNSWFNSPDHILEMFDELSKLGVY